VSLLTRIIGPLPGEEKISPHVITAAIAEYVRGAVTAQQVFTALNLNATEQQALTSWFQTGVTDRLVVSDVLFLGEAGLYSLNTCKSRLGIT